MKTSELTGAAALDWAVAKCEGLEVWLEPDGVYLCEGGEVGFRYRPSTEWAQGGPIIERERISPTYCPTYSQMSWQAAYHEGPQSHIHAGSTPLIAAMRCYVASRLGDEVDVPDELLINTPNEVGV